MKAPYEPKFNLNNERIETVMEDPFKRALIGKILGELKFLDIHASMIAKIRGKISPESVPKGVSTKGKIIKKIPAIGDSNNINDKIATNIAPIKNDKVPTIIFLHICLSFICRLLFYYNFFSNRLPLSNHFYKIHAF